MHGTDISVGGRLSRTYHYNTGRYRSKEPITGLRSSNAMQKGPECRTGRLGPADRHARHMRSYRPRCASPSLATSADRRDRYDLSATPDRDDGHLDNRTKVILEVPAFQRPARCPDLRPRAQRVQIPLSIFAHFHPKSSRDLSHQGAFPAVTVAFKPGSRGGARRGVRQDLRRWSDSCKGPPRSAAPSWQRRSVQASLSSPAAAVAARDPGRLLVTGGAL